MDTGSRPDRTTLWAFWIACGLAAVGGVAPFLLAGVSSRINGVVFPFALAAIALGACALLLEQGRPVASGLYVLASLAIVYGILAMLTVPLRLAIVGICPPAPAACPLGFERPITGGETTAMGFAIGLGIAAMLTGFFGLATLYRRNTAPPPLTPPARRIAPVASSTPAAAAVTAAPPPTFTPDSTGRLPDRPDTESVPEVATPQPEPELELPAGVPQLELEAPAETLELPAPARDDTLEAAPSAPQPKPGRRRMPKGSTNPAPAPDSDGST